jgi:transcriptional regulator with XRE-family HTH domain
MNRNNWLDPEMSSPEYMKGFAIRLKLARERAGFETARTFAIHLGVKEQTYGRYERGETTPPYELLKIIASVTKHPLEYFI